MSRDGERRVEVGGQRARVRPIDFETAVDAYLVQRRWTRRELLERMAALGAVAVLTPIAAACQAAATVLPSSPPTQPPGSQTGLASPTATPAPTPQPTPESELYVYNWDEYIGPDTIAGFQQQYGIQVTYDKFPDEPTQIAKIQSDGKGGGYDVTYPASTWIHSLSSDGVLLKLDQSLIPNLANLAPAWMNPGYDPGNGFSVPNYWWTTGYAWNPDKVPGDLTDWANLWDPSLRGHLAMLDDMREVFAVGAFRLGLSPNTTNPAELDQILALLEQQKPLVRIWTEDDIGDLTSGQVWITHAWSGDWFQMIQDKPNTKYVIPSEGAVRGNDTMVILSGAKHPIAAHLWLNYNLDPQVSANNTNAIGYMGPNLAAQALIDPTIVNDPRLNPPADVQAKLVELGYLAPADLDQYTQRWNTLRA